MDLFLGNIISAFHFFQSENLPAPEDNWWLAFVPLLITAIIFFIVYWGFKRFLRGDRFIAKLFGISEEAQRAKMLEFQEKVREEQEKENRKNKDKSEIVE
jgi:amino acid permease